MRIKQTSFSIRSSAREKLIFRNCVYLLTAKFTPLQTACFTEIFALAFDGMLLPIMDSLPTDRVNDRSDLWKKKAFNLAYRIFRFLTNS